MRRISDFRRASTCTATAQVVVVLAGGHTTGSVVIFVTGAAGKRYAFIGDLTWQLDGSRRCVERPWLLRKVADCDPEQVRQGLLRVIALADLMQIVPAHDRDAYEGIPSLPVRLTSSPDQRGHRISLAETASTLTRERKARNAEPHLIDSNSPRLGTAQYRERGSSVDSEITWLLHRAAERMRSAPAKKQRSTDFNSAITS